MSFKKLLSLCEICVKSLGWLLVYRYHTVRFIYDCAEVTIVEFHVSDTYIHNVYLILVYFDLVIGIGIFGTQFTNGRNCGILHFHVHTILFFRPYIWAIYLSLSERIF